MWTVAKVQWCCAHEHLGCPESVTVPGQSGGSRSFDPVGRLLAPQKFALTPSGVWRGWGAGALHGASWVGSSLLLMVTIGIGCRHRWCPTEQAGVQLCTLAAGRDGAYRGYEELRTEIADDG